jgi:putative transposase
MAWADKQAIRLRHIQPDKPQRNAYVKRFSRTVQHDSRISTCSSSLG